jgi:hypothetical protein
MIYFLNEAKALLISLIKKKLESLSYKGAKLPIQKSTLAASRRSNI